MAVWRMPQQIISDKVGHNLLGYGTSPENWSHIWDIFCTLAALYIKMNIGFRGAFGFKSNWSSCYNGANASEQYTFYGTISDSLSVAKDINKDAKTAWGGHKRDKRYIYQRRNEINQLKQTIKS